MSKREDVNEMLRAVKNAHDMRTLATGFAAGLLVRARDPRQSAEEREDALDDLAELLRGLR